MTATQDTLIWPERLTLRDTKVIADQGQRIFTTATGYGYERQEYVIATALADRDAKIAELEKRLREIRNNAFNFQSQITELTQKLERAAAPQPLEGAVKVERVETGPVRIGDDWAGIFIRGDNALHWAFAAAAGASAVREKDVFAASALDGLAKTLRSCCEPCEAVSLSALSAPAGDGWRLISDGAPELDRVLVAGWQQPSGKVAGYWWMHEDVIINGLPDERPNAVLWHPFPARPNHPAPAAPYQGDGR